MRTVLIVDDEVFIRQVYSRIVLSSGSSIFRVLESGSVQDALEKIISENVELILLDIRLPDVNGRKLYDAVRRYNPDIKIIVSSVFPVDEQRILVPNADDYYDKSEGALSLFEKITNSFACAAS